MICFSGSCHPALVGANTPAGTFNLQQRITDQAGYTGDVLEFHEDATAVYAIHRVWTLNVVQHRTQRLASGNANRRWITMGCINVEPVVYETLVDCCSQSVLKIEP